MTIGIDASKLAVAAKTGVEWYVHHLLKAMMAVPSAHSFRLYTKERIEIEFPSDWREKKIRWPLPFFWTQGGLSLEMLLHPPDLLFAPSSALPVVLPGRCITTIHDVGFLNERKYRSAKELRYLEWSTRRAVTRASHIITVSEFSRNELIAIFGADEDRVTAVPLAAIQPPELSSDQILSIRKKYNVSRPYLVFVSRIDSRKNVDGVISAFELLKEKGVYDGDLLLVGPLGYDGADIVARSEKSRHAVSIRHVGWISEREKFALLSAADVFVFPSHYEGFGMVVLEAQSVGVPVVCSQTTSMPEVAGDAAVFVDPLKSESIAEGIMRVLDDEEYRHTLIARGYKNCSGFSWEHTARSTLSLIDSLL
ncbi:MAG: glycosyltransferase family 1 protein [Patescibacteria group bacterium]